MNIAKLDLYNPEWLELVFDDKNKEYGAYDLRKRYGETQVKAMIITFFSVAFLLAAYTIFRPKPEFVRITPYESKIPIMQDYTKKVIPPPATVEPPRHHEVATTRYPVLVARPDREAENPPKIDDLKGTAIGTENKKGNDEGVNIDIPEQGTGPDMNAVTEHKDDVYKTVEVEPEPYGGAEAWAKFLQKNIHYPPQASENGVHGKVFLSFIVETDGRLSNIKVEHGVGSGLDEEALRVLRIAPAWKPGIQNGHKVRVMYDIPINFVLPDQE